MPKKRAHEISDSEEEVELQASSSTVSPSKVGSTPRDPSQRFPKKAAVSNDEDDEQDGNKSTAMEVVPFDIDADVGGSFIFFGEKAETPIGKRTPQAFKVVEASVRAGRKQLGRMFAFLIDRSPSTNDNLETFVGYIVKRKLADAFMRMKFDKNFQHDCVVMTCCDSETKNLSNSNQEKKINHHCVELIDGGVINPAKVTSLKEKLNLRPENEQFSNLLSGLMTAADIINRHSEEASGYSDIELMIFSDLGFDVECTTFIKMKNVLKQVLSDAILTVVSDRDILSQDTYNKSIMFFGEIFSGVTSMSYQDAMRRSEEWSMKELMPTKFSANIRLFEEELPVEAYLICAEKNESILENRMERVGSDQDAAEGEGFTAAVSTIKPRKSLVKLTDKGFYEKDPDGNVVTVHPERTVMAYRFGTTAVPSSKPLKEYIKTSESFKGYVVKGWYPSHQFLLHLSGGRGYHVFSSASDGRVALFDTLLHLCAYRGHSLLVDYAYATRFASKPGVLVPHLQKHCFVFFDLIYQDNMNYLPR
ncbi:uncharacterized protein LOC111268071 isoform X3 [Varroa jacobsoni]|nr:uncharacterized protein LOC111250759 isoform X3 [Varroa destructor]XP_022702537.1 uncharacterized protein LOC111268071 isoform X3 [Varroa jacobsoni]